MSTLLAAIIAALPSVFIAIAAKLFSQSLLQKILERVIVYALDQLTPLTTNTLDDEIAADIKEKLRGTP